MRLFGISDPTRSLPGTPTSNQLIFKKKAEAKTDPNRSMECSWRRAYIPNRSCKNSILRVNEKRIDQIIRYNFGRNEESKRDYDHSFL